MISLLLTVDGADLVPANPTNPEHDIDIGITLTEFNLPNESHVRGDLISSLRQHYNIWRFHLHANYYLKWNTDAKRRANCPKDIDPSHWNWIISYWGSARFKILKLLVPYLDYILRNQLVTPWASMSLVQVAMADIELGTHTIRSHGRAVAKIHMHDWSILILLIILIIILNVIEPFHRFVGRDMMADLRYPLKRNIVPVWAVPWKHIANSWMDAVDFNDMASRSGQFSVAMRREEHLH
ncbi:Lipid phosphate phosphatase 2 [Platanthera guangdongensis]|uniref:Lipid phosphate phosphatase 2 n=1 Tax=Platanthera guangdongensis TaxID=2320717 RepID=A0ABR2M6G7_9ASPA